MNVHFLLPDTFSKLWITRVGEPFCPHSPAVSCSTSFPMISTGEHFERMDGNRNVAMRSNVTTCPPVNCDLFPLRRQTVFPAIFITDGTISNPSSTERQGGTCAVSPSTLCRPQNTKSGFSFFMNAASVFAVASVSAPA